MRYAIVNPDTKAIVSVVDFTGEPDRTGFDDFLFIQNDRVGQDWTFDGENLLPPEDVERPVSLSVQMLIVRLEGQITPRRMREALPDEAGGTPEGRQWLKDKDAEIAALRSQG